MPSSSSILLAAAILAPTALADNEQGCKYTYVAPLASGASRDAHGTCSVASATATSTATVDCGSCDSVTVERLGGIGPVSITYYPKNVISRMMFANSVRQACQGVTTTPGTMTVHTAVCAKATETQTETPLSIQPGGPIITASPSGYPGTTLQTMTRPATSKVVTTKVCSEFKPPAIGQECRDETTTVFGYKRRDVPTEYATHKDVSTTVICEPASVTPDPVGYGGVTPAHLPPSVCRTETIGRTPTAHSTYLDTPTTRPRTPTTHSTYVDTPTTRPRTPTPKTSPCTETPTPKHTPSTYKWTHTGKSSSCDETATSGYHHKSTHWGVYPPPPHTGSHSGTHTGGQTGTHTKTHTGTATPSHHQSTTVQTICPPRYTPTPRYYGSASPSRMPGHEECKTTTITLTSTSKTPSHTPTRSPTPSHYPTTKSYTPSPSKPQSYTPLTQSTSTKTVVTTRTQTIESTSTKTSPATYTQGQTSSSVQTGPATYSQSSLSSTSTKSGPATYIQTSQSSTSAKSPPTSPPTYESSSILSAPGSYPTILPY